MPPAVEKVRPPRCLVCDRDLADSELATCHDVHAACPAQPEVSLLEKVRAAAPVAGWPDSRAPGDLVCPRCAALVNDIVIYESRLADVTQQLVTMVTATMLGRVAASETTVPLASDKPKLRRPRKVPPKKNKSSDPVDTPLETHAADGERRLQQACDVPPEVCHEAEDEDDPSAVADTTNHGAAPGAPPPAPAKSQENCTWLVTTEPAGPRRRQARQRSTGPHTCTHCHKQLSSTSSLHKHLLLHTNERRFKCAACDKAFFDRRALQRHEVDHTGVRPFCCATCGKTLLSSHALRIHQRNHLGIKPAQCHVCHRKMSSSQMLREHLRIHTGERPFGCELCGRTFRTERILASHQRTHTGVRPHVCAVCGRSFNQRTPLTAHLRSHSAEQLAAVRRERIGHTAIRTAAGIFDAKDGRSVRQLDVTAAAGGGGGGGGGGAGGYSGGIRRQQQQAGPLPPPAAADTGRVAGGEVTPTLLMAICPGGGDAAPRMDAV